MNTDLKLCVVDGKVGKYTIDTLELKHIIFPKLINNVIEKLSNSDSVDDKINRLIKFADVAKALNDMMDEGTI